MKILDKIALNRTIVIIGNFILKILSFFSKKHNPTIPDPSVKTPRFPWLRNLLKKKKS